ncbi:MAG: hypothetical protein JWM68_2124 [Verrucomicrobiales bacterium]|nr:hypothetical protein [Verrucomicrobiales bacterium]
MSRVTPKIQELAQRIVTYETKASKSPQAKATAVFQLFDELRPHLTPLMGSAGYAALLARALAITKAESITLSEVQVKADGTLDGFDKLHVQIGPEEILNNMTLMLAHLLSLLVTFIGEDLTLRLLSEGWPKLSLMNLVGEGGKNEKQK